MEFVVIGLAVAIVTALLKNNPEMVRVLAGKEGAKVSHQEEITWIMVLTGAIIFVWYREWPKLFSFFFAHPESLVLLGALVIFFYKLGVDATLRIFLRGAFIGSIISLFGAMRTTCQLNSGACPSEKIAEFFASAPVQAVQKQPAVDLGPWKIVLTREWSKPVEGVPGYFTSTQRQDSVAFEDQDQSGNIRFLPKVMRPGMIIPTYDSTGKKVISTQTVNNEGRLYTIYPLNKVSSHRYRIAGGDSVGTLLVWRHPAGG